MPLRCGNVSIYIHGPNPVAGGQSKLVSGQKIDSVELRATKMAVKDDEESTEFGSGHDAVSIE
jgi:hypothetical protein